MVGGGWLKSKIQSNKKIHFPLTLSEFKKNSPYIHFLNSLAGFGASLRAAPGDSCPPRYATGSHTFIVCP